MQYYRHKSGLVIIEGKQFYFKNNNYPFKWWKEENVSKLPTMGFEPIPTPPEPKSDPVDPLTKPLNRHQLRNGLLALGVKSDQIVAAIQQEPDDFKREQAMIDWEDAGLYHFDHPLVAILMSKLGMSPAVAKAKWADMVGAK